jgi:hypothetical protein
VKEGTMNDPADRAAAAAADEVRNSPGQVDGREELARRVGEVVDRELHRPVILGRSIEGEPTPFDEGVIDYLDGLPLERLTQILDEAMSRRKMGFELEEIHREQPPDPDE